MCYGMELTYKLATKQLIFIINPCHVTCLLQLTILCMNPFSSTAQHLFRQGYIDWVDRNSQKWGTIFPSYGRAATQTNKTNLPDQ